MDHLHGAFPSWLAALLAGWLLAGFGVCFSIIRRVAVEGGKVSVKEFSLPDDWLCGGFILWFTLIIGNGFGEPGRDVTQPEMIRGAAIFLGIVILVAAFLQYRGIDPIRQFGLSRLNPFLCLALAAGLLLAAYPAIAATESLTALAMHGKEQPENVVEYFLKATQRSDGRAICLMMLLAVVVAPAAEETLFRGYIYGVLKRRIGGIAAACVSAGLFAAMHLNAAALPALFVLALCLTLAYEATGSLLVNICMHAFFNLTMLLVMLYFSGHGLTP